MQKRPLESFVPAHAANVDIANICGVTKEAVAYWRKVGVPDKHWGALSAGEFNGPKAEQVKEQKRGPSKIDFDLVFSPDSIGARIAEKLGVSTCLISHWRKHGVPAKWIRKIVGVGVSGLNVRAGEVAHYERDFQMRQMFATGHTLQQIGDEFGVSRERVRQILARRFDVRGNDGGNSLRVAFSKVHKAKERQSSADARCFVTYGCTVAEAVALNGGDLISKPGSPARRFVEQRRNAVLRDIEWRFTFPEWMKVWQESGRYEQRGRGQGYVMARIGDTGAYQPGNVEIIKAGQNSSDSFLKVPALERAHKAGRAMSPFHVCKVQTGFHLYVGHPRKRVGYFKTEAAATARGLELTAAA